MRKNFRLLSLLLLVVCVLMTSCRNKAELNIEMPAEIDQPCVFAGSAIAKAGEDSVEIAICVQNNPGILGMTLELEYNEDVLTLEKIERGDALRELTFTKPKLFVSGSRILWDGETVSPKEISNGVAAILKFSVADTATPGVYAVNIRNYGDVINNDLATIHIVIESGTVTVS